ncbi:hypothetical protein Tdes44962_MAKER00139 [Teratosphaeria destructans]|uniref:F-box domain-containing protein n=1 Tax=Teratosphaeria destructans TaxID=418781 RepID=A0A9W7W7A9_9PEZI|nr:hypothetical protein Tdes44962_MAKER00139 [Teratosphaeria destructans]
MPVIPRDVWLLVFQRLVGDYESLRNVSLVSRDWRVLSWPCLLQIVDLTSHNLKPRLTQSEFDKLPVIRSHHHAKYPPVNLISRQRCFLSLISGRPHLAKHVKSLAWTLLWREDDEDWTAPETAAIEHDIRETWNVFTMLLNVTHLDLASLHYVCNIDLARQNPPLLFPRVTHLRLLGWPHRRLVKAISQSIQISKLRSLRLDYLEDRVDGSPSSFETDEDLAHTAGKLDSFSTHELFIDDDLFERQEKGEAAIFPGPLWYPMRLFSAGPLESLQHVHIALPQFDVHVDVRNYYTAFRYSAHLLRKVASRLRSLVIIFDESRGHYYPGRCGTGKIYWRTRIRPWCVKMAAAFLKHILFALSDCSFPHLSQLTFEGFHLLEGEGAVDELETVLQYLNYTPFKNVNLTGISHIERADFEGFDYSIPPFDEEIVQTS